MQISAMASRLESHRAASDQTARPRAKGRVLIEWSFFLGALVCCCALELYLLPSLIDQYTLYG